MFGNVFDSFINSINLNFPYTCYITARIMEYKKETQSANAIYTLINADKSKLGYLTLWFKCKKIANKFNK